MEILSNKPWLIDLQHDEVAQNIRVPKLLDYDDEKKILVIEDAGKNTKTLHSLLKSDAELKDSMLKILARSIFIFLTYLNKNSDVKPETHGVPFENKPAWNLINNYVREVYFDQAKKLNLESQLQEHLLTLGDVQDPLDKESVFVYGDFWPASILIDTETSIVWFIDFEMCRFSDEFTDIQQFFSYLWIMKHNPILFKANQINSFIDQLQIEFYGKGDSDWRVNCGKNGKSAFILWILCLLNEDHFEISNPREIAELALREIENF